MSTSWSPDEHVDTVPVGSAIEQAVDSLVALDELEVADHPAVFESVHRVLRDQLAAGADGDA